MSINHFESNVINQILNANQPRYKFNSSKLQYNSYYNSPEFWFSKWPKNYENIPQINIIVDHIIEKNKNLTPLQEILQLQNNNE
jgi:hypothetical protein